MAKNSDKKVQTKAAANPAKEAETRPVTRAPGPFEEIEQMMESLVPRAWFPQLRREWPDLGSLGRFDLRSPRVDVLDKDDMIVVDAEIPGVDKDDLDITVAENTVTIKGESKHEEKKEDGEYFRSEITRGAFSRTVALPVDVEASKAQATFGNGMLKLKLPKKQKANRVKIEVK